MGGDRSRGRSPVRRLLHPFRWGGTVGRQRVEAVEMGAELPTCPHGVQP